MRGALAKNGHSRTVRGITPAYAGSTAGIHYAKSRYGDHPRVCGEHSVTVTEAPASRGSPPRMRGAHARRASGPLGARITPAYAGSTGTQKF